MKVGIFNFINSIIVEFVCLIVLVEAYRYADTWWYFIIAVLTAVYFTMNGYYLVSRLNKIFKEN